MWHAVPVERAPDAETLDNDAVVKLVAAGLGEELILTKMKYSRCVFALSSSDLAELKQKGISDHLIAEMFQARR